MPVAGYCTCIYALCINNRNHCTFILVCAGDYPGNPPGDSPSWLPLDLCGLRYKINSTTPKLFSQSVLSYSDTAPLPTFELTTPMTAVLLVQRDHVLENNSKDLDKYVCPHCKYLLRDAVQQMCCGHWLCECCALQVSIQRSPRCPQQSCLEPWGEQSATVCTCVRVMCRIFVIIMFFSLL